MPNRTIYLPDDLDVASRRLGLNLSRVTQEAVEREIARRSDAGVSAAVAALDTRLDAMGLAWPRSVIATGRRESAER